jgi:acyl-[acyl carrier protein]--UDP-N-acetylglucosamine O-acyltransferase
MSRTDFSRLRGAAFPMLSLLYLLLIFGSPLALIASLRSAARTQWQFWLFLLSCPMVYAILFPVVAAVLSIPHQRGIIAGKFPRDVRHSVYFHRRLYGLCFAALYYCKPIYFLVLSIDPLRKGTFRLFGYRGNLDFTIYPDTWIRDLPLLSFGVGAYLSNKATIGTNIVLANGRILVGPVTVEEHAVVGHGAMLAPGCHIGKRAEIGAACGLAINVRIEVHAKIGAMCGIDNGVFVGSASRIGGMSGLGPYVRIADGISIPRASAIPERTHIANHADAIAYVSKIHIPSVMPAASVGSQIE